MLLTDEEIAQAKTPIAIKPFKHVKVSPNSSASQWDREVAKAQLKKVVGWLMDYCDNHTHGAYSIGLSRIDCPQCRQALLGGIK